MKTFIEQARLYAEYHQNRITFYTHLAGVPLIVFSLIILLGFLHLVIPGVMDTTLASWATFALWIYYLRLNWRLGLLILPILALLLWFGSMISYAGPTSTALSIFITLFIVGWIFQLIGHLFEGRRPAFMDNLSQLLIAPLYLTAELCFMAGRMQPLEAALHDDKDASI